MQLLSGDRGVLRPRVSREFSLGPELSSSGAAFGPVLLAGEKKYRSCEGKNVCVEKMKFCHPQPFLLRLRKAGFAIILGIA